MHIKNWLVYHVGDRALKAALDVVFTKNPPGPLLDIGCGLKPYAGMTAGRVSRHVGVDHPASLHGNTAVDAASSAYQLPFREDAFTTILCSSVLEHLFAKAGFDHIDVRPLSGFWVTFGQLFVYQLYRLQRGPMRWIPVIPLAAITIQLIALALDKVDRAPGSRKWTWAYLTVAHSPRRGD